ncbi:hypothetical protein OKW21_006126 [Catalinimonas alkaloidigena]|nr:hypothetical protein [Catalinimonas alkaloidigena]
MNFGGNLLVYILHTRGRPVLTGCVVTCVSMQAHRVSALINSSNTIIGESNYAMAA